MAVPMADINKAQEKEVTVEDLLRLKRAERPDEAFWGTFDRELHQRMLQSLVKKDPWYVQVLRGVSGRIAQTTAVGAAAAFLAAVMLRPAYVEWAQTGTGAAVAQQDSELGFDGSNGLNGSNGSNGSVSASMESMGDASRGRTERAQLALAAAQITAPVTEVAMADLEVVMTPDYQIEAISAGVDAAYTQDFTHDRLQVAAYDSAAYVADTASFAGSGLATGLVY